MVRSDTDTLSRYQYSNMGVQGKRKSSKKPELKKVCLERLSNTNVVLNNWYRNKLSQNCSHACSAIMISLFLSRWIKRPGLERFRAEFAASNSRQE